MRSIILKCTEIEEIDFTCKGCGFCCRGQGEVYLNRQELNNIADFLKTSPASFKKKYTRQINGKTALKDTAEPACIFLTGNKCEIYPVRPQQCRTFPFWLEMMQSQNEWQRYLKNCKAVKSIKKTKKDKPLYLMVTHKTNPLKHLKKVGKTFRKRQI